MRSNSTHTTEEIEYYIQLFLVDGKSIKELKESYGLLIHESNFRMKVRHYQKHGIKGILGKTRNNCYSSKFKEQIVSEYLEKNISIKELAIKYNIPSHSTVRNWIIRYTEGKENRGYTPLPEVYTMKSRKTTHEERILIVEDYLNNSLSYKKTAQKHKVNYNNVYSWVQKYKEYGPEGLIDSRGRRKPDIIQTQEEKLKNEIAALKARNKYLETENAALKKLEEVERELMLRKQNTTQNIKPLKDLKKRDLK